MSKVSLSFSFLFHNYKESRKGEGQGNFEMIFPLLDNEA